MGSVRWRRLPVHSAPVFSLFAYCFRQMRPEPAGFVPAAVPPSEPDAEREVRVQAAEIELVAGEQVEGEAVRFDLLPAQFAADRPVANRRAHAAKDRRASGGSIPHEPGGEERESLVGELTHFPLLITKPPPPRPPLGPPRSAPRPQTA